MTINVQFEGRDVIEFIYRHGEKAPNKCRPMVVELWDRPLRDLIAKMAYRLKKPSLSEI